MMRLCRRALCSSSMAGLQALSNDVRALKSEVLNDVKSLKAEVETLTTDMKTVKSDVAAIKYELGESILKLDLKMIETTRALETRSVQQVGDVKALLERLEGKLTTEVARINATLKTSVAVVTGIVSAIGLGFAGMRYYDTGELKKELEKKDMELKRIEAQLRKRRAKKHAGQMVGGASVGAPP